MILEIHFLNIKYTFSDIWKIIFLYMKKSFCNTRNLVSDIKKSYYFLILEIYFLLLGINFSNIRNSFFNIRTHLIIIKI